jgi:long-subunit acyl-CoA synthetase (AMP-forming)
MSSSASDSLDDVSLDFPEIDEGDIFTFVEYIIIVIIIIILGYIIYRLFFNQNPDVSLSSPVKMSGLQNSKNIIESLRWAAKSFPDSHALMIRKDNGVWLPVTYESYYQNCLNFAKIIKHWVGPKTNVAIIGFNSPAWFYAHLGTMMNSGIPVGMYPSNSSDACEFIMNHAKIDVLVVEDGKQLEKFVGKNIPMLKLILYYSPVSDELVKKFKIPVVSFGAFMDSIQPDSIELDKPGNDIATIIYTSGTLGDPKGVMLTHKNIVSNINAILKTLQKNNLDLDSGERFVSYLPLNHIAAQTMDIYIPISVLGTVWFADKDALKSTLVNTLKDARPTVFVGVPRVWEKMQEKIDSKIQSNFISRNLPNILIRSRIVNEIGLDKCKFCITSTAPVSEKARDYFESLNLPLYDAYGLSETSGPITLSGPGFSCKGSVGIPINDVRIRIADDGEILVKGKSVFKGYYRDKKGTEQAFADGWFKTLVI